jgi:glycosyltransferase involved in cell wall biosynthesis
MTEPADETNSIAHVLYVVWTYPKYSETFVRNELMSLRGSGCDVRVVTVGNGQWSLPPEEEASVIRVGKLPGLPRFRDIHAFHEFAEDSLLASVWAPIAARRVLSSLNGWRPDVVHVHFIDKPALLGLHLARLVGVPVTITAHARDYLCHVSRGVLSRRILAADQVFTISVAAARKIQGILGANFQPERQIRVVRASASFSPSPSRLFDDSYVLTIARLVEKKGLDTSICAFAAVATEEPALQYLIVGDGPEHERLTALVDDLGLSQRVHFLGARAAQDAQALMRDASAFVLCCRESKDGDVDGIPVVLMEAGLGRTPVVTTAVGGISELVTNDISGVVLTPDDIESTADALRLVLREPVTAEAYTSALHARVVDEFGIGLQRRRLVEAWSELAGCMPRRTGSRESERSRW